MNLKAIRSNAARRFAGTLVFYLAAALVIPGAVRAQDGEVPVPEVLARKGLDANTPALETARLFLGTGYRNDGTIDSKGDFTLFEDPGQTFSTPGLNCSGLVLSLSRFLFGRNLTLDQAVRDRRRNSGPDAPWGEEWDFGLDLILNISEGLERRFLGPDGPGPDPETVEGRDWRGFDLTDQQAWSKVMARMKPEYGYLVSFSKTNASGRLLHYHVAVILLDGKGRIWLHHTTPTAGKAYRMDLASAAGMERLRKNFKSSARQNKKIMILEVLLPGRS